MASNPAIVSCTVDTWILVAEDVQSCTLHKKTKGFDSTNKNKTVWYHTYTVADDGTPSDMSTAIPWPESSLVFEADADCDVYIYAAHATGSVRVDA